MILGLCVLTFVAVLSIIMIGSGKEWLWLFTSV